MRCLRKTKLNYSLDVDRSHVLEDSCAETFAPVGHRAVLESSMEQDHVTSLAGDLDGILVEILLVVGVAGLVVRVGPESSAAILRVEICEECDELKGEWGGVVHDVRVGGGQQHPVVGVVQVGQLPCKEKMDRWSKKGISHLHCQAAPCLRQGLTRQSSHR